jgi:hypothetical protein
MLMDDMEDKADTLAPTPPAPHPIDQALDAPGHEGYVRGLDEAWG